MPASILAAQLYTLRDFCKTPADIAKTLAKVKKIGYDAVQVSGMGPIDPKELARILHNEGLTCCATHIPLDRMKNEPQAVIDEHHLWGCRYTAIGGLFLQAYTTQTWHDFARSYSDIAAKFAGSGLSIGYHNHSHELAHFDGKPALQILIERCSPQIWFEIDTYWIAQGGGDPCQWIARVSGRIPCVHLKDIIVNTNREVAMAECGEGNLNWPGILQVCKTAGVEWYIVEQDTCQRDPFESLAISLRNLKAMGLH